MRNHASLQLTHKLAPSARYLCRAIEETLWPTRCALCDMPGAVLCERCKRNLPYLDQVRACPRCGAAHGRIICCECNQIVLDRKGLRTFPLDGCVSTTMLNSTTRRAIVMYKDRGEQRLASVFARLLAYSIPPAWTQASTLIPIPSRKDALRKRGFDHIGLIGRELSRITDLPLLDVLVSTGKADQRQLNAQERIHNMRGTLRVHKPPPPTVILIDDVFTTGSTLFAATAALRSQGVEQVFGLTFARA